MRNTNDLAQLVAALAQLAEQIATRETDVQPEPRPMPPRVLLTVEEAAERLGIGRTMTYRLVRSGQLESVQIGRLRRIPASAIDDYAAGLLRHAADDAA